MIDISWVNYIEQRWGESIVWDHRRVIDFDLSIFVNTSNSSLDSKVILEITSIKLHITSKMGEEYPSIIGIIIFKDAIIHLDINIIVISKNNSSSRLSIIITKVTIFNIEHTICLNYDKCLAELIVFNKTRVIYL